jgi:hypothetical protein
MWWQDLPFPAEEADKQLILDKVQSLPAPGRDETAPYWAIPYSMDKLATLASNSKIQ